MHHNIITLFFIVFLAFGTSEATWVTERQCDLANSTFGVANARNGNCMQAYDPKDGYVLMSCTSTNFTTYRCQDEGCTKCKPVDTRPLNQCVNGGLEGDGRFFYQCFPNDEIEYEKVIDAQSYLLQTFFRGNNNNEPCDTTPTQIFISPVDTCFSKREKSQKGFYIACHTVDAEFREYDNNSCNETPIRTYRNQLEKCYSVANELGEVITCVMRK